MGKKNKGYKSKNKEQKKEFNYNKNSKRYKLEASKAKNKDTIEQVPSKSKFSKDDLEYGISQIDVLFSEANRRIEFIKSQGFTSFAIDKLESESNKDYFDLEDIVDRESLVEQLYRVRLFLNDKGSTIEGAKLETAQINSEIYKGKFGNQYNTEENNYAHYDTKIIDKEFASRAFESYRKLEQTKAGQIAIQGGYGSENLITALYDAEIRGLDSLVYGNELLEIFYTEHLNVWDKATKDSDNISSISGQIYDNLKERYGL